MTANTSGSTDNVQLADSDEAILACFDCMRELRTHLTRESFVERIRSMQANGYRLAYLADGDEIVGVAGFRLIDMLYTGPGLYVDDLSVVERGRSKGYGGILTSWLRDYAVSRGCDVIHLDSGTQRDRAHKFYFAHGFHINAYHFLQKLR